MCQDLNVLYDVLDAQDVRASGPLPRPETLMQMQTETPVLAQGSGVWDPGTAIQTIMRIHRKGMMMAEMGTVELEKFSTSKRLGTSSPA